jgi:hypothetical protein
MGCRHRRVKKAVNAIHRARASGDREAVRKAVDRAKKLNPGQRDSERELRSLTGNTRGRSGTDSSAGRGKNSAEDDESEDDACLSTDEDFVDPSDVNGEARVEGTIRDECPPRGPRVARPPQKLGSKPRNVPASAARVIMPDGGSCVARRET